MARIDMVHTDRLPDTLERYKTLGKEHNFKFAGKEISVMAYDFRSPEVNDYTPEALVEKTKFVIYFMGFAQSEHTKPHDLTGAIIDRAKANGEVLLIPRFKDLPIMANIEDEVLICAMGVLDAENSGIKNDEARTDLKNVAGVLRDSLAHDGISINLAKQDITLYGYSDGNRLLVQTCGHINKIIRSNRLDGTIPKRKMISLSSTGIIDEASRNKNPTGKEHTKRFNNQVVWAAIEETRLRLNHFIDKEKTQFEELYHQEVQAKAITEREDKKLNKLHQELLVNKNEGGQYTFPLLKHGLKHIDEAHVAMEPKVVKAVLSSVLKLNTFLFGRQLFADQWKESSADNLGMLYDVLQRAATGKQNYSYEELGLMRKTALWKLLWEGLKSIGDINAQFANAEHRQDEICNDLKTFDVECIWPREDMIAPDVAYGQTIWKILKEDPDKLDNILRDDSSEYKQDLIMSIQAGDKERLGTLFLENFSLCVRWLFPNARTVYGDIVGRRGGMDASHLAVTKSAKLYGLTP